MVDEDGSALEGVRRWVESSGRALELRVAREFSRRGANGVDQSFGYTDPVTNVRREGDVLATFSWDTKLGFLGNLRATIECKSGRKHPWVAFYDRRQTRVTQGLDPWVYAHYAPDTRALATVPDIWIGRDPFTDLRPATHIVAAHASDSTNPAGDAVRQVLSAAESQRLAYVRMQDAVEQALVLLPVVVTAAPLFQCTLDEAGEVNVRPADELTVWGDAGERGRRRVWVMNETRVSDFAAALTARAGVAAEEAELRAVR